MMTKIIRIIYRVIVVNFWLLVAIAEPMDVEESKKIPCLEEMLVRVRSRGYISELDAKNLKNYLSCSNSVVASFSIWIIAQSKNSETNLCSYVENNLVNDDDMVQAFAKLLPYWKNHSHEKKSQYLSMMELFVKDKNPYLRIEAAKEIYKIDSKLGEMTFQKLLKDKSVIVRGEVCRQLETIGKKDNLNIELMPDEEYELLVSIIENNK